MDLEKNDYAFTANENLFLKSVICNKSENNNMAAVLQWIKEQREKVEVQVKRIAFDKMKHWGFDTRIVSLRHYKYNEE